MAAGHPSPAIPLIPSRRNHNRPPADAAAPSNGSHLNKLPSQTFKSKNLFMETDVFLAKQVAFCHCHVRFHLMDEQLDVIRWLCESSIKHLLVPTGSDVMSDRKFRRNPRYNPPDDEYSNWPWGVYSQLFNSSSWNQRRVHWSYKGHFE